MHLYLIRHGKAADRHPEGDFARPLVAKGFLQSRRVAAILTRADKLPDICLTSPLVRARQTAETFCTAAGIPGPVVQSWLASGMNPETAVQELLAYATFNRVAIFGHEPDFSSLIEHFLGITGGAIEIKKGAAACVTIRPPSRTGTLRFLIPPALAEEEDDECHLR